VATLRTDLRTEIRDYIYEASGETGAIWSDAVLNRMISREVQALPSNDIYLEETWTTTTVVDQYDYTLPTGTQKVEQVERNDGTTDLPDWNELNGCDTYGDVLTLPYRPSAADTLRIKIKKAFTIPSDDTTNLEVPDDKCEVIVVGVALRCFKRMIGYLSKSVSWDTVTKPGDLAIPAIQSWIQSAKQDYKELIKRFASVPKPRDINLVS